MLFAGHLKQPLPGSFFSPQGIQDAAESLQDSRLVKALKVQEKRAQQTEQMSGQRETRSKDAYAIEIGYDIWLRGIAPRVFHKPLAWFHDQYWAWLWELQQLRRIKADLEERELGALVPWGRGLAKSTSLEFTAVSEGALIEQAFGLYISSTQDKANEHVAAVRDAVEASEVSHYYPGLSNPRVGKFGNQRGWRRDALYTDNGFAIVGVGLDQGIRGLKDISQRPTIFFIDDIDERNDTPLLVEKKWKTILHDILPMAELSQPKPITIFAQNLIHRGSVMAKTMHREIPLLSHRKQFGPINTFKDDLVIEKRENRKVIIAGTPNWERIGIPEAQILLDNIGEDAFRSECQNEMIVSREERVLAEFEESLHVITWSMFAAVVGTPKIPTHWQIHWGHDWGTTGPHAHPAILTGCAVGAEDSPVKGDAFLFYTLTADAGMTEHQIARKLIGDLSRYIWHPGVAAAQALLLASDKVSDESEMWALRRQAGNQIPCTSARMSHEQTQNAMRTYNLKWGFRFQPCDPGKTVGLSQINHYLEPDRSRHHPFKPDVMGKPSMYLVVDDDQLLEAKDDRGFKRAREEAMTLRWDPNIAGRDVPMKRGDDFVDSLKMIAQGFRMRATGLTQAQQLDAQLPEGWKSSDIAAIPDPVARQRRDDARREELERVRQEIMNRRRPVTQDSYALDEGSAADIF